ncbi:MAG: zinc ABC transporter substrate-binding protein [Pseudomonadota bacterium]|nr:zinc ABC transporter substrate-binding protein [Pseudomonadota bacterium]
MKKRFSAAFFILLIIILTLGSPSIKDGVASTSRTQLPISIFVNIGPHLDFCQQIGGDRVSVQLLLPPGKSPGTYAPTPQQVQTLSRAQLFFKIGLPFEKVLLEKIKALPKHPQIIDTQTGITLQPMPNDHFNKSPSTPKNHHHQHRSTDLDPHSWLDPRLALKQATTIYNALSRIDPEGNKLYLNNLNSLKEKLQTLHKNLTTTLAPLAGSTIFVYHPAFSYFARAYNLHQLAVEVEGKRPKAKELAQFIKKARQERARVIFVQPQFDQKSARKIADSLNCAVISLDPLAQNYCANLNHIGKTVRNNLQAKR